MSPLSLGGNLRFVEDGGREDDSCWQDGGCKTRRGLKASWRGDIVGLQAVSLTPQGSGGDGQSCGVAGHHPDDVRRIVVKATDDIGRTCEQKNKRINMRTWFQMLELTVGIIESFSYQIKMYNDWVFPRFSLYYFKALLKGTDFWSLKIPQSQIEMFPEIIINKQILTNTRNVTQVRSDVRVMYLSKQWRSTPDGIHNTYD